MSIFLGVLETAKLLGVSKQAVQLNCKAGKYQTQQVKGRGGLRYEIALNSLPKEAQDRYHEQVFNQQVEVIYGQEKSRVINAKLPRNQREDARENSPTSLQALSTSGNAINGCDERDRERNTRTNAASNKIGSHPNGCSQIASGDIAGVAGSKRIAKSGLSGSGQSGVLAVDSIRGVAGSVSNNNIALQNTECDLSQYTDDQRKHHLAIKVIFAFIDGFGGSELAAIRHINMRYITGDLPRELMFALDNCKEKKRANAPLLSRETLYSWKKRFSTTGSYVPKKREKDFSVQWWHDMALFLYRRPQKPTLAYVVTKLAEFVASQGVESDAKTAKAALVPAVLLPAALVAPSYGMVERFFKDKVGQIELKKGRNTGMKLRSLKAHKTRTAAGLEPWDEMQSDGLASHFTAPHPMSGEYRTLEVWHAHDVATRIIPPFAVGESENTEVIFKCIENAVRFGGVMVGIQTDHTKVVKDNEKFVGNPMVSIADRAGITIYHPKIAGNSQANGIAENFGVWLNNQAKELCSYQHSTMDSLSFRRMQTLLSKFARAKFRGADDEVNKLRKEIKRMAAGVLFESHQDALDWLEEKRVMWNNRPHSALPKVHDDVTGKKRHQTPQEAFDEFLSYGWQPVTMDEDQLIDLFRPRLPCRVFRGKVKPYSPKVGFYHAELSLWEGKEVVVSWDIMDSSEVRVLDMTGALICMAKYDAPVGYRGQTAREASIEKRDVAKLKRLGKKVEGIRARSGLSVIDSTAVAVSPLKQVVYEGVEFATEPTLRTFADLLADERDENKPVVSEPVDYWGTVQADSEEDKEAL